MGRTYGVHLHACSNKRQVKLARSVQGIWGTALGVQMCDDGRPGREGARTFGLVGRSHARLFTFDLNSSLARSLALPLPLRRASTLTRVHASLARDCRRPSRPPRCSRSLDPGPRSRGAPLSSTSARKSPLARIIKRYANRHALANSALVHCTHSSRSLVANRRSLSRARRHNLLQSRARLTLLSCSAHLS